MHFKMISFRDNFTLFVIYLNSTHSNINAAFLPAAVDLFLPPAEAVAEEPQLAMTRRSNSSIYSGFARKTTTPLLYDVILFVCITV